MNKPKCVPDPHNLSGSARFVRNQMPGIYKMLLDRGYDVNWDEVHNLRIKAAGLRTSRVKDHIRYATGKPTAFKYLMWLIINVK